jgi:sRNA-binding carbon storage regulator CsrA
MDVEVHREEIYDRMQAEKAKHSEEWRLRQDELHASEPGTSI